LIYLFNFAKKEMSALELKAYEILKNKPGEQEASTILEFIEEKSEQKINQKKDTFLTKDDKVDLIKWMVGFWIAQMAAIIGLYVKSH
jgi:hypothetical protein